MKVENPPQGWLSPGTLITLSEIMRFAAGPLFTCLLGLERLALELRGPESGEGLNEDRCREIESLLKEIERRCLTLELHAVGWHTHGLKERLKTKCSGMEMGTELARLRETIEYELEGFTFVFVSREKNQFFQNPSLFGKAVDDKFPSARLDIQDAGNCLALGLNKAVVFHLMRVAELGLRALAQSRLVKIQLDYPIEFATWGKVIEKVDEQLGTKKKTAKSHKRENQLNFYSGLLIEMRAFQYLWRDPIMHARSRFDGLREAENAFGHVREFMQRLAANGFKEKRTK